MAGTKFAILFILWAALSAALFFCAVNLGNKNEARRQNFAAQNEPSEIKVASWNFENYSSASRIIDGKFSPKYPKAESEKRRIVEIISQINPDILFIQEIGAENFGEFLERLKSAGLNYPFCEILQTSDTARCLAVVSKVPFGKVFKFDNLQFAYMGKAQKCPRGLLGVKVGNFYLFTLHLKSRRNSKNTDKHYKIFRKAQAAQIAKKLAAFSGQKLIVCGDFNSEPNDTCIDEFKNTARLSVLPQADKDGEGYTLIWKQGKKRAMFDFFLLSEAAKPCAQKCALVYDTKGASDHRIVAIKLICCGNQKRL
ncbi:MAG: endonuclease/exonuclease/phosphatase family protein [Opitutales bacterium]|nr:endonuclease/exonuclease/phosphatase family protein [Opitutales bacterium]